MPAFAAPATGVTEPTCGGFESAGRVVSKTMILSHVWGYDFDPGSNVVDVLVFRLRDKIDRDFSPPLLHTVRGVGYVLKVA